MNQDNSPNLSDAVQCDVSRETLHRMERYAAHLLRWTEKINLIARAERSHLWQRHITDSAQIFPLRKTGTRHWVDLGSGGGLPGLVNAILAAEMAPDIHFTLIESDKRKAAFLRMIAAELGLDTTVLAHRAEDVPALAADTLTARAVSPLRHLLGLAALHLGPAGRALLPKGRRAEAEMQEARQHWDCDILSTPSILDPGSSILQIENIRPGKASS